MPAHPHRQRHLRLLARYAGTHVTVSGSYSDAKPLRMKDRPFLEENFKRAVANSPATFYSTTASFTSGATPNIVLNNAA